MQNTIYWKRFRNNKLYKSLMSAKNRLFLLFTSLNPLHFLPAPQYRHESRADPLRTCRQELRRLCFSHQHGLREKDKLKKTQP